MTPVFTRKLTSNIQRQQYRLSALGKRDSDRASYSKGLEELQHALKFKQILKERQNQNHRVKQARFKRVKSLDKHDIEKKPYRSSSQFVHRDTYEFYQERYYFINDFILYKFDLFPSENIKQRIVEDKLVCEKRLEHFERLEEQKKKFFGETKLKKGRVFTKLWKNKIAAIKAKSPYNEFSSYTLRPVIIKGGDDLRQEIFAMQLIKKFHQIFQEENTGIFLRPYEIIVTSANAGFLEFLTDTIPISSLKKKYDCELTLEEIYRDLFVDRFEFVQKNFIESLAGYSLLCYLLQIKDRHNGNIMIGSDGHMMHIDFGFLISIAPGNITFESAPFKLTQVISQGVR